MNAPFSLTTRIVCLGNELRQDDGLGLRLGRVLERLELPPGVTVDLRQLLDLELVEDLLGAERLILVDALRTGAAPGTPLLLEIDPAEQIAAVGWSHTLDLSQLLQLARRLAPERPLPQLIIFGVEAAALEGYGLELSAPLTAALPATLEQLLRLIEADDQTLQRGQQALTVELEGTLLL